MANTDSFRLMMALAAEREEAKFHADLKAVGNDRITGLVSGLRLSILQEPDAMKRAILRGAFLATIRYLGDEWATKGTTHGQANASTDDFGTGPA